MRASVGGPEEPRSTRAVFHGRKAALKVGLRTGAVAEFELRCVSHDGIRDHDERIRAARDSLRQTRRAPRQICNVVERQRQSAHVL